MRPALGALSTGEVGRQFVGSGCTSGNAVPPYGRRCLASDLEWFRCLPAPPDLSRGTSLLERSNGEPEYRVTGKVVAGVPSVAKWSRMMSATDQVPCAPIGRRSANGHGG